MKAPELLKKFSKMSLPRYTSYPTAPEWEQWSDGGSKLLDCLSTINKQKRELALYIHIPFCVQQCWYCGCNTVIKKQTSHADNYLNYLFYEIDLLTAQKEPFKVKQLHIGGGTPNFLTEKQLQSLMNKVEDCFDVDWEGEFSVEVDPRTCTVDKLENFRRNGFNRVSMGIQDFNPEVQRAINRIQPYEKVEQLVLAARELEFKSVNFDLVYGLPHQTEERFKETLRKTLQLKPDRLALYSFAYLPQVKPHMKLIKPDTLPQASDKLNLFLDAYEVFTENGYAEIAMDHFALEDDELSVAMKEGRLHRNFMGYTVQDVGNSLGLGVTSISYIDNTYVQNTKNLNDYYASLDNDKLPVKRGLCLNKDDRIRKWVIAELMCNMRLSKKRFQRRFSLDFDTYFTDEQAHLNDCVKQGLISNSERCIIVKDEGKLVVRFISSGFDSYLSKNKRLFSSLV